jgi:hypothetical protein
MTTVTLNLPEEIEQKLHARANVQGKDIASVAMELVEHGLKEASQAGEPVPLTPVPLTPEERVRELEEWVKSLPRVDVVLDVSRETIYEGRGE